MGSREGRRKRRTKNIDAEFWLIEMADGASKTNFALVSSQDSTNHCGLRFQRIHDRTVMAIGCLRKQEGETFEIPFDTLSKLVSVEIDKLL